MNNNSLIQPNYHIPFWNGHDSTNYNLKEIIIRGIDKYPRQYQDISWECWLLLPPCWWPPSADPPHGSGGTGVTEALNNPCCQRGRRQNEQTPWTVLTNPPRRRMPSAALSHSGISFSVKQNLTCKEPNSLEGYWCSTLDH